MKNLILITIAVFTLQTANAQRPNLGQHENMMSQRMSFMEDFSAEQIANIQTKRMALMLNLSEEQITKISVLNLKNAEKLKDKMTEIKNIENKGKPSSEDRYKMMMGRMDHRIAYKKEIKTILDKEQFEKWEELLIQRFGSMGQNFGGKPDSIKRG